MSIHGHEDSGLYQGLGSGMDYITRPSYERPPGSTYKHPSEDEEDNAFLFHLHDPVSRQFSCVWLYYYLYFCMQN